MITLVSEHLRDEFGGIRLELIFQDRTTLLSCIRRVADEAVLSFHIVLFFEAGITALGKVHESVVSGGMLGEMIQKSGVPYTRTVSEKTSVEIDANLTSLFVTEKKRCTTERIEYQIRGVPYATIYEFYNPKYTPVAESSGTLDKEIIALMQKYITNDIQEFI